MSEHGYSIAKVVQALGISENNLRRWKKELEQEVAGERLSSDERAELIRLRRENKELRLEKETLKTSEGARFCPVYRNSSQPAAL